MKKGTGDYRGYKVSRVNADYEGNKDFRVFPERMVKKVQRVNPVRRDLEENADYPGRKVIRVK